MRWFYLRDANRRLIGCVVSTFANAEPPDDHNPTIKYASAICSETDNYSGYTTRAFKEHARCYAIGRLIQDIKTTTIAVPKDAIVRSILGSMLANPLTPRHAKAAIRLKLDMMTAVSLTKVFDDATEFGLTEAQIDSDTASTIPALEQAERMAEVTADVGIALPTTPLGGGYEVLQSLPLVELEPILHRTVEVPYVFSAQAEQLAPLPRSHDDEALDRLFSDFHGDHSHH